MCIFYQILMPPKSIQSNNLVFRMIHKVYFHIVSFSSKSPKTETCNLGLGLVYETTYMNCSLGLGLKFETVLLSVLVSVSFRTPRSNKSRSQSCWQDQSVKSLGLSLVYKSHMASSLGLVFKYWSRQSVDTGCPPTVTML